MRTNSPTTLGLKRQTASLRLAVFFCPDEEQDQTLGPPDRLRALQPRTLPSTALTHPATHAENDTRLATRQQTNPGLGYRAVALATRRSQAVPSTPGAHEAHSEAIRGEQENCVSRSKRRNFMRSIELKSLARSAVFGRRHATKLLLDHNRGRKTGLQRMGCLDPRAPFSMHLVQPATRSRQPH